MDHLQAIGSRRTPIGSGVEPVPSTLDRVESLRLRRARFVAVLLGTSAVLGLLYGVVLATVGQPDALLTWWGTGLRAVLAVLICLGVTNAVDRRWAGR
jgi:hypothetical protein